MREKKNNVMREKCHTSILRPVHGIAYLLPMYVKKSNKQKPRVRTEKAW